MALEVRRRRVGAGERAVEIIDVVGRLDAPGAALLRSSVQDSLKEGSPRIAVNLAECVEIHREMIGTFHSLARACSRAGGGLVLFGQTGDVEEYVETFADPDLAPWRESEQEAILTLGGEVEAQVAAEREDEPPVVVALGRSPIFRGIFWKLSVLGGRPVAKFDAIETCTEYLARRSIHSILVDTGLPAQEVARFLRQIRSMPRLRSIGVFLVGPPSDRGTGRALVGEGANTFVPLVFSGEEIAAKLDARAFFARLKEVYERFDARAQGRKDD